MDKSEKSMMDIVMGYVFAQKKMVKDQDGNDIVDNKEMPASRGFKVFGEEAIAAMIKEFRQLHKGAVEGKPVVTPTRMEDISEKDMERVLEAVNLI